MDISRNRLIGRIGGGLASLIVAAGLSAAGATASSAQQRQVADTVVCGTTQSATMDGVHFQIQPCVRRGLDIYGVEEALGSRVNLTITADPARPVIVCRWNIAFRNNVSNSWNQREGDCMNFVDAGQKQPFPPEEQYSSAITSATTLVTVEFAAVDGPIKVVSARDDFTGPF
jgi:hypothetical protein